jgi:hypothetical protein
MPTTTASGMRSAYPRCCVGMLAFTLESDKSVKPIVKMMLVDDIVLGY